MFPGRKGMGTDRAAFDDWLRRYFEAWGSNDPQAVASLFADDAEYHTGPFSGPRMRGRAQIVERWTADPDAQRDIRWSYDPLAVEDDLGVAHWTVTYSPGADPDRRVEMDGILVIRFDGEGRYVDHREWYATRETRVDASPGSG